MLTTDTPSSAVRSPLRVARLAAVFYTLLAAFGGVAHIYIRGKVYVPGDGLATTEKVVQNVDLVRFGVVADLIGAAAYLLLALALHRLLRHLQRDAAHVMVILVAIGAGITCINMVFQIGGVLTATELSYTSAFVGGQTEALTLLMFDMQFYGYIVLQVFTGLWLVPFGYLALKSDGFPKLLCWMIMLGSCCYLADLVLQVMWPSVASDVSEFVLAPVVVAEMWMIVYLWFRGVGSNFRSQV